MREIYIKSKAGLFPIGRRGENLATRVHLSEAPADGQAVTVYVLRNGDSVAYPASNVEITDTEIIWTVTSVDTDKSGRGKVQYRFADAETGEVNKTEIYYFIVSLAIDTEVGPAPDPYETWLDSLTELAGQAQIAARDAEADATRAAASAESASESAQNAEQSASSAGESADIVQMAMPIFEQIAQRTMNSADAASNSAIQARVATDRAITAQTEAESAARQASASADSAAARASEASQSSTNARSEANRAETYADLASASAGKASASETLAGQSATAASASATSASQSATTATAKASEASASATTAATKASEASASATAAQEARTGAETAQAGAESAAQTAQAGADAVGLLKEQIYNSYPNVEAEEGSIVSISDGADGIPVKSLVVGIEPVQEGSGDPSPDNVRPITGWTGATVQRTGKNLFDASSVSTTHTANWGVSFANDVLTIEHKNTYSSGAPRLPLNLPEGTYTIKCESATGAFQINKNNAYLIQVDTTARRFTVTAGDTYEAYFYNSSATIRTFTKIQLELGSTPTSYEPYQGTTYPITFPTEAGTVYGGSLDVTNGVLTVTDANIASYNGETLPSTWISDRDVYAEGATPTTGAQVVFKLATPITYQLTPTEVQTLLGANNVWADSGNIQEMAYRADTKLYIDGVYEDYQDDLADYADALTALG